MFKKEQPGAQQNQRIHSENIAKNEASRNL